MQSNPNQEFLDRIRASLDQQAFIKLTLGKPRGVEASLEKILVRLIELQGAPLLSFVYRHKTHDITKNFSLPEGLSLINSYLGSQFHSGHLFTADRDVQFEINKKGEPRLTSSKPTSTPAPTRAHDDAKQRSIPLDRPWLQLLGVTRSDGRVREGMAAKFRQINKFVELLSHLCNETPLSSDRPLSIVDMGSGKGYLTFATYDYFTNVAKRSVTLRGIELRPELVELCNKTAYASGFSALHFDAGTIAENHAANPIDILIALHACDTATDDALFQGLKAGASLLVVSPCCQKELRSQLKPLPPLTEPLRHGIFQERHTEFVTDALRALLLEREGYDTKVFEFISTEHTAKNLMIAASKSPHRKDRTKLDAEIGALKHLYGIISQRLETLLNS